MSSFFKIGSNMRERCVINAHGNRSDILYSYETPVATISRVCLGSGEGMATVVHVTDTFHSATTTRHINRWLAGRHVDHLARRTIEQSRLDELHHFVNAKEAKDAGVTA